jgi:hypothetical protein
LIGTRTATALAFILSIAALALGVTALALSLREDDDGLPEQIQTGIDRVDGDPVPFPLYDFYLSGDERGVPRALYMYPPGYYGHIRGCKVLWVASDVVEIAGERAGPGLFVDPCGGARFDRVGRLVAGAADRGLDRFDVATEVGGAIVSLDVLYCGEEAPTDVPVVPVLSATPSPAPTAPSPPLVVTPAPPGATATPTASATASATPSATASSTPSQTPVAEPTAECDRVGAEAD